MNDYFGIPALPFSTIVGTIIDTIASVAAKADAAAEAASGVMRVEDGVLCCTDKEEDVCCSYCCFIDFET